MAFVFAEVTFYSDNVCLSTGWGVSDVLLNVETSMRFWDCYKNVIYTLCGFDNLSNGKLLDYCGFSEDEQISITEWNPIEEEELHFTTGSDDYGVTCSPGQLFSPAMTSFILKAVAPYFNQ